MIIIYTYEMVGVADENGRLYESEYGTYNTIEGFRFNSKAKKYVKENSWSDLINILVHENLWKCVPEKVREVSLEDLERELGYRVRIVDPQPEKKEVDEKHRKAVDDTVKFFKDFFGMDLDPKDYY